MILMAAVILLHSASIAGSMPGGPGVPENITITFLNPTSVKVSWDTSVDRIEKYDVRYKQTEDRMVAHVAGNSEAVTLTSLKADTQYQVTVVAVWGGKKYRSRPIVFRTLEPPRTSPQQDAMGVYATSDPPSQEYSETPIQVEYPQTSSTVRGVEIGIVLIVLLVWVGAIALFFNRWGKIRMLLPYQPDYKQEQLKVPGTAACAAAAAGNNCNHHSGEVCTQNERKKIHLLSRPSNKLCKKDSAEMTCVSAGDRRCHFLRQSSEPIKTGNKYYKKIHTPSGVRRPRLNSAIFTSYSGAGFDSKEFMRRHGSQSQLCRKARSVDNISLETDRHFGLPMLSISGPSPPEDEEETDETDQFIKDS